MIKFQIEKNDIILHSYGYGEHYRKRASTKENL